MDNTNRSHFLSQVLVLAIIFGGITGCSFLKDTAQLALQKEKVELKKKNYLALQEKITSRSLKAGISAGEIKRVFGEPDDIFRSGSGISNFEIWTYENVTMPGDDEERKPIRLYVDNGRLISWTY